MDPGSYYSSTVCFYLIYILYNKSIIFIGIFIGIYLAFKKYGVNKTNIDVGYSSILLKHNTNFLKLHYAI